MKKGIVIALAIAVVFMFVSCGDKPNGDNDKIVKESLEQQLIGTSWYQTTTTETEMGPGVIRDNGIMEDGQPEVPSPAPNEIGEYYLNYSYYVENITLTTTTTTTYKFKQDTFIVSSDIIQKKSGITTDTGSVYVEEKEVSETTTYSNEVNGTWNIENDRLYMIENNATQGTSFAVSIINDELILENEYAGIFLRLKRK